MDVLKSIGLVSLTTLLSLVVLFLLTKLMGAKQVSQMTMFDYVEGITIGSVAAELATDLDAPLNSLTALVLYGLAAVGISLWTSHSLTARRVLTGKPLVLLEDGVLYRDNLKKAKLDINEFLTFCRIAGWFDLNQLQTAILEHNGVVSFLPKETDRPATPSDLGQTPKKTVVQTPFIMDGRAADRQYPAGREGGELGAPGAASAGLPGGAGRTAGSMGRGREADRVSHGSPPRPRGRRSGCRAEPRSERIE